MATNRQNMNLAHLISITLFVSALCACSSAHWETVPGSPGNTQIGSSNSYTYEWDQAESDQVAPGFLVALSSSDPKVNGEYRIEADNIIQLPYNVSVQTLNKSEKQLETDIRNAYRSYFRSPGDIRVAVAKKEYLLNLQGLVKKPGHYAVRHNASLDEVIAQAGGLDNNENSKVRYVRIIGAHGSGIIRLADYHSGAQSLEPNWRGGETLYFQTEGIDTSGARAGAITVLGQVKNPADYNFEDNASFFPYLIRAGGPTDRADLGNVTLIRSVDNNTKALSFNTQDFENVPPILPGDTIIVNADNVSPLERKSRIGASFASIITSIGIVIIAGM